jgi:hypothetical protein
LKILTTKKALSVSVYSTAYIEPVYMHLPVQIHFRTGRYIIGNRLATTITNSPNPKYSLLTHPQLLKAVGRTLAAYGAAGSMKMLYKCHRAPLE